MYLRQEVADSKGGNDMSYKYTHLSLDERIEIQRSLKDGKSFSEIGAEIGRDPSTISKEVRNHREMLETGTRSRAFNPCVHRQSCEKTMRAVMIRVVT